MSDETRRLLREAHAVEFAVGIKTTAVPASDIDAVRVEMEGGLSPDLAARLIRDQTRLVAMPADRASALVEVQAAAIALSRAVEPADLPPAARVELLRLRALLAAGGCDPVGAEEVDDG